MSVTRRLRATATAVVAVAAGGSLGGVARYELGNAWPYHPDAFPWSVFAANVLGCMAIGALMVAVEERLTRHRFARPFIGVGLLGGFTTFSTYALDGVTLWRSGEPYLTIAYLGGTLLAALAGVMVGIAAATGLLRLRRRRR